MVFNRNRERGRARSGATGERRSTRNVRFAFTLVELLVVIGIIALLISILMPALNAARRQAQSVACLSNLRQVGQSAVMHANEHRQHFPLAGHIWTSGATPAGVEDLSKRKYEYFTDGGTERIAPIPAALSRYLGQNNVRTDSRANLEADLESGPVRMIFACPSDEQQNKGSTVQDSGWTGPLAWTSYVFNEGALGWWDDTGLKRARGNLAKIRFPAEVMFMADGLRRTEWSDDLMDVYDHVANNTLRDAILWNNAGTPSMFDHKRHRERMNVVFMDGHAATIQMADGLDQVYLSRFPGN